MFSKFALIVTASLAAFVAAGPSCNTGPIQCCQQLQSADSASVAAIFSLIGAAAQGVTGQVGFGCSPITAVGVGSGAKCEQKPVCCQNNDFHGGLISIGCSPIDVGL